MRVGDLVLLIRELSCLSVAIVPDVAWVGDPDKRGLSDALTRWFGPAAAA